MNKIVEDVDMPEIFVGTIENIPTQFSGLQTVCFTDRSPVHIENYGHRQLITAAEHLGQENLNGMQIEFSMDDMGLVMNTFNILGNEGNVACYGCQTIMERYIITEEEEDAIANEEYEFDDLINGRYYMCAKCGRVYCPSCEAEKCTFCEYKEARESLLNSPTPESQ